MGTFMPTNHHSAWAYVAAALQQVMLAGPASLTPTLHCLYCRYYDVEIDDEPAYSTDGNDDEQWRDNEGRESNTSRYRATQRTQKRWSPDSSENWEF